MICSCEQANIIKIVNEIIKVHQLIDSFLNLEGPPHVFGSLHKLEKHYLVMILCFAFCLK